MLTYEQRHHFAEKGWILLQGVFDAAEVAAFARAVERADRFQRVGPGDTTPDSRILDSPLLFDDLFLKWLQTTAVIEANKQCLGTGIRYRYSAAHMRRPHPDRALRSEALSSPGSWRWHRDLRPKWGLFPDDADPELINAHALRNLTFLSDVAPNAGALAVLNGSHRREGEAAALLPLCLVEVISAAAGDVLLLTETLFHAETPILDETPRLLLDYGFAAPWLRPRDGMEIPSEWTELLGDEALRRLFDGHTYIEQEPAF